ncbi:MAG TPA: glycosyltransferase [Candidatus Wallbacteria bacterium]|nr:glycosyltransferase [Candidatus Wallbacteria bacterium]
MENLTYYIFLILYFYNYFMVFYFIMINFIYILLNFMSFFEIREYVRTTKILKPEIMFRSNFFIPISIIVPAYNESGNIVESIKSLLQLHYPEYEIIIVNDGSKDNTLDVIKNAYKMAEVFFEPGSDLPNKGINGVFISTLYKNLILIDKINGGKADALNAGINYSKHPYFCGLDADSILESKSLLKISRPFIEDPEILAVGGIIRIVNGCTVKAGEVISVELPKSPLANFQIVEYLRAFLFGRTGWSAINAMLIISGAFGIFKKKEIIAIGGYRTDTVGEDMELIVRLHNHYKPQKRMKIKFVPDPVCYTEVPENLSTLYRQRNRWQRGLIDSLLLNRNMLFNPRYGSVGLIAMPFFFIFEMLGPVVEFTGYLVFALSYYLEIVDYKFALLFLTASISLGIILSVSSILLEEISFKKYPKISQVIWLFFYSIIENFGYRQLNTYFRFRGTIDYILGSKHWGEMKRKGFKRSK